MHVQGPEEDLWASVLSFHMAPGDQTRVSRRGSTHLFLLSHPSSSSYLYYFPLLLISFGGICCYFVVLRQSYSAAQDGLEGVVMLCVALPGYRHVPPHPAYPFLMK